MNKSILSYILLRRTITITFIHNMLGTNEYICAAATAASVLPHIKRILFIHHIRVIMIWPPPPPQETLKVWEHRTHTPSRSKKNHYRGYPETGSIKLTGLLGIFEKTTLNPGREYYAFRRKKKKKLPALMTIMTLIQSRHFPVSHLRPTNLKKYITTTVAFSLTVKMLQSYSAQKKHPDW